MAVLSVLICSTRPGRVGLPIAEWLIERARAHAAFDVDVIDLAELGLPFVDEPNHPRLRQYVHQHTKDWSARVSASDAFVFVLPEYNHGYSAPLKNAIDFLHEEWKHKPVGFVSYGGVAAGTRAIQSLEPVLTVLRMTPVVEQVNIPFFAQFIDDEGQLRANEVMEEAATAMLDAVARAEEALRPLRMVSVAT